MDDISNILALFPDDVINNRLGKMLDAMKSISNKTPIIGVHRSFYFPGWIGIVQNFSDDRKMVKLAEEPFYNGMNYLDFANWLVKQSSELASMQKLMVVNNEPDISRAQNEAIVGVFMSLWSLWGEYFPEYATQEVNSSDFKEPVPLAVAIKKNIQKNLKDFGFPIVVSPYRSQRRTTLKEDTKVLLYRSASLIINAITLGIIAGIVGEIFC